MLLSRNAILRHLKRGTIIIDPFKKENLGNTGYDVTLGEHYWRKTPPQSEPHGDIYNPFDPENVYKKWKRHRAVPLRHYGMVLKGIAHHELVIWLAPGETILAHTEEFIGGHTVITTQLRARSTAGRNDITVCRCAGKGDVGFINRWTMEITNNDLYNRQPLVVGRRYAQIEFHEVEKVDEKDQYHKKSDTKYQIPTLDIEEIKKRWESDQMIPKMWKDREALKI